MTRCHSVLACVLAVGGARVNADAFIRFVCHGLWVNPAVWNGPVGQYPGSIADTATISVVGSGATMERDMVVGTRSILSGASVGGHVYSVFVYAHTLRITRIKPSTSRPGWSDPVCGIIVCDVEILLNELPGIGSPGGRISVSGRGGAERFAGLDGPVAVGRPGAWISGRPSRHPAFGSAL